MIMDRTEIYSILKKLSEGFLLGSIKGDLYTYIVEALIVTNIKLVPELENFADFLAQYHSSRDLPELYGDKDLIKKIKKIFNLQNIKISKIDSQDKITKGYIPSFKKTKNEN